MPQNFSDFPENEGRIFDHEGRISSLESDVKTIMQRLESRYAGWFNLVAAVVSGGVVAYITKHI